MDKARIDDFTQRVRRLRAEAEALGMVAHDFPALKRNADRLLACVSMMEMDLGMVTTDLAKPAQEPSDL